MIWAGLFEEKERAGVMNDVGNRQISTGYCPGDCKLSLAGNQVERAG